MPRKTGVLVFAAFLFAASYLAGWVGTGGLSTSLDLADSRALAATEYALGPLRTGPGKGQRTFTAAWMRETGDGYEVSIGYETATGFWLTTVEFDQGGIVLSNVTRLWTGMLFPGYLRGLSAIFAVLWVLAAFVAPNLLAVKCPDCPRNLIRPPLTEVVESTVFGGGFDKDGHDLSPIVRRDYVCPRCGYRKITFYVEPRHSGGLWATRPVKHSMPAGMDLNPKEMDWYERIIEKYESEHEGGRGLRFPNYEDWKAFLDELKSTEWEEHAKGRH